MLDYYAQIIKGMSELFEPPEDSAGPPIVYAGPFFRTLIAPLAFWGCMVGLAVLAKQPGVVCLTPMAWLLALMSGTQYVRYCEGRPGRYPIIGPALLGGLVGLGEGAVFILVAIVLYPLTTPEDIIKGNGIALIIVIGRVLICAGLSSFIALVSLRRYPKISGGRS